MDGLRVDIAYLLGQRNTFAHLDAGELHPSFGGKMDKRTGSRLSTALARQVQRSLQDRSKEDFVKHYREKHGLDLPLWVAVEIWDFGAISQLLAMMKVADQQQIAAKYGVNDWKVFKSWVRSLSYLRNLSAHTTVACGIATLQISPACQQTGDIDWCDDFIGKADLIARPFFAAQDCQAHDQNRLPAYRMAPACAATCAQIPAVAFKPQTVHCGHGYRPGGKMVDRRSRPENKNPRVNSIKRKEAGAVLGSMIGRPGGFSSMPHGPETS